MPKDFSKYSPCPDCGYPIILDDLRSLGLHQNKCNSGSRNNIQNTTASAGSSSRQLPRLTLPRPFSRRLLFPTKTPNNLTFVPEDIISHIATPHVAIPLIQPEPPLEPSKESTTPESYDLEVPLPKTLCPSPSPEPDASPDVTVAQNVQPMLLRHLIPHHRPAVPGAAKLHIPKEHGYEKRPGLAEELTHVPYFISTSPPDDFGVYRRYRSYPLTEKDPLYAPSQTPDDLIAEDPAFPPNPVTSKKDDLEVFGLTKESVSVVEPEWYHPFPNTAVAEFVNYFMERNAKSLEDFKQLQKNILRWGPNWQDLDVPDITQVLKLLDQPTSLNGSVDDNPVFNSDIWYKGTVTLAMPGVQHPKEELHAPRLTVHTTSSTTSHIFPAAAGTPT